ncbi:MAG: carbohydrate kinase [Bacteroidetes bacterium]|nr:carbohydrate kinase [Bacteroidota bacterium]
MTSSSTSASPVIAVFDIGKTNKKLILFDETYRAVYETSARLDEKTDEDGFPCEDLMTLTHWVKDSFRKASSQRGLFIKAINVSAYGASFVHLDERGLPVGELINYLKPFPDSLMSDFLAKHDPHHRIFQETASPKLGHLNSGLQLLWLKYQRPALFSQIRHSLHLPQFISFLFSGKTHTEMTSIGCHTLLWNFHQNKYHDWVRAEQLDRYFPAVVPCDHTDELNEGYLTVGVGLHDSSAALLPYLRIINEPFALISSGTWCITLNPFNHRPLTEDELAADCLCYMSCEGKPVKASRLFAGQAHEVAVKKIAAHFHTATEAHHFVYFQSELFDKLGGKTAYASMTGEGNYLSRFQEKNLSEFDSYAEAYHYFMIHLVQQQYHSTQRVVKGSGVKKIFVDGGFSNNEVFMNLLAQAFPDHEVYSSSMPQASSIGAALAIHHHWNSSPLPKEIIQFKRYLSL